MQTPPRFRSPKGADSRKDTAITRRSRRADQEKREEERGGRGIALNKKMKQEIITASTGLSGVPKYAFETRLRTVTQHGVSSIGFYGETPEASRKAFADYAREKQLTWTDGTPIQIDADGMVTI